VDRHQAGLDVAVTADIDKRAWMKLMVNAAINPLTALLRIPNGRLMSNPHLLDLAAEVVDEGVAVARASQVHLPSLFGTARRTRTRTAAHTSAH
jgi:2-dehydropantoate 2-reductase